MRTSTDSRQQWVAVVLFLGLLVAIACAVLVVVVLLRTRAPDREIEATVAALATENAKLATQVAVQATAPVLTPTHTATPTSTPTVPPTDTSQVTTATTDAPEPTLTSTAKPKPPSPPGQPPQILTFTADPSPADPAGTITLKWKARGASSVTVAWADKDTETVAHRHLPLSGSLSVAVSGIKFSGGDHVQFSTTAYDAADQLLVDANGKVVSKRLNIPLQTEMHIASFTAGPDPVERGGTVTLAWNAPGADSVGITRLSPEGDIFLAPEALGLPASGSVALQVPEGYVTTIKYYLGALDLNGVLRKAYVAVGIICPYDEYSAPECPLTRDFVWAAYEPFERGHMVWRGDTREIYVLYDDGSYETYEDTWHEGDPVDIPGTPPSGLYAPVRGFGNLWASQPEVRNRIGWATAPEGGYTMLVETVRGGSGRYPGTGVYLTLPDNRLVNLYPFSSHWQILP